MAEIKRKLPEFLADQVSPEQYARSLERKAAAHVKRRRLFALALLK